MTAPEYLFPFTVGFLGSLHCLGMCGPLIIAYSLPSRGPGSAARPDRGDRLRKGLRHHLAFHAGRLLTYGFLGALAAGLFGPAFKMLSPACAEGWSLQAAFSWWLLGLMLLRLIPLPAFLGSGGLLPAPLAEGAAARAFQIRPCRPQKPRLGLLIGFLPCGLSWAMIVKAATAGSVPNGFFTMFLFGLGTLPVLLAAGLFTTFLSLKLRLAGERLAAFAVLFMGIFMVAKWATRVV